MELSELLRIVHTIVFLLSMSVFPGIRTRHATLEIFVRFQLSCFKYFFV